MRLIFGSKYGDSDRKHAGTVFDFGSRNILYRSPGKKPETKRRKIIDNKRRDHIFHFFYDSFHFTRKNIIFTDIKTVTGNDGNLLRS